MLYPQLNESRMRIDLNGIWSFQTAGAEAYEENQVKKPLEQPMTMAVPASYNDQKDDVNLRSHYGWAVYQRTFKVPHCLQEERLVLRFGAVTHQAEVYLNGEYLGSHKGGFLPFEFDVTERILEKGENLLSVAVDNRVNFGTLPVGNENNVAFFGSDNPGIPAIELAKSRCKPQNKPNFDFFNYTGIIRPVWLYTTPKDYIQDVSLVTDVDGKDGIVKFQVETVSAEQPGKTLKDCDREDASPERARSEAAEALEKRVQITILNENGQTVAESAAAVKPGEGSGYAGTCVIPDVHLWNPGAAYLYTARVTFGEDVYEQTFGVRTVEVKGTQFLINGKPFYFKGFGKHEDSFFRGRGTDSCLNVKDLSLFRWMHANSFRTSHYPYAEEMYDLCDREGILVIDETPAVGIGVGGGQNAYQELHIHEHHRDVIRDMIARDKNHPCVVMWSLANEPDLANFPQDALDYFTPLYELAHSCDPQNRPVTLVCCQNNYEKDLTTRTMDVVCLNRYYGWYNLGGDLDAACDALNTELDFWEKQGKPVMFTEYGADTYPGIHNTNGEMFSEEYQADYYMRIDAEIDKRPFFIGEQLWNFADFATIQGPMRVDGNKKGVLTRDRRPKLAAHALRRRWKEIPDFGYKK
ncbi:MAG: beta galactosidase jelly roll domain-containing protein [Lachnospiraceae bacterium]|nr:beta galactosidase jelly roll domain-containing protein [Lachnospiraceae bacterium]